VLHVNISLHGNDNSEEDTGRSQAVDPWQDDHLVQLPGHPLPHLHSRWEASDGAHGGGETEVAKVGHRHGDQEPEAVMELNSLISN